MSFCSDDGTTLIQELTPPADPNWDPKIREPKVKTPREEETQWFPREAPAPGGWIAPADRPPLSPGPWQAPPPPFQPRKQPSQSLALASMITSIIGIMAGGCFGPIPGIIGLVLGLTALSQIKKSPEQVGGKPYATAGVIIGGLSVAFYLLLIIWFVLALSFS